MADKQPGFILRIVLPVPLRRVFDYLPPIDQEPAALKPGIRVSVPFGQSKKKADRIGVLLEVTDHSDVPHEQLKTCTSFLDTEPVIDSQQLELLKWASTYYHHSLGEVIFSSIPAALRKGLPATLPTTSYWRLRSSAPTLNDPLLNRAKRQFEILKLLSDQPDGLPTDRLKQTGTGWRIIIQRMVDKGWIEEIQSETACFTPAETVKEQPPDLNPHQTAAVETISAATDRFQTFLLDGVTGSGKTEVYFRVVEKIVSDQRQALVLIPEIGLTAQLIDRFKKRFSCPVTVLHSGLSDKERLTAWLLAREGKVAIIIGTRSAIWTPLANPGVIFVDEEHDASYKQQDGFRYSARDIAIIRAQRENIPVILGSATPSLETLNNIRQNKCQHLVLPERAGQASQPVIHLLDIRGKDLVSGLSKPLIERLRVCLEHEKQALLFLNRRGFSPVIMCHDCGWIARCRHCDANLTYHQAARQMRCHHCGAQQRLNSKCPECEDSLLSPVGQGTEQITEALEQLFPEARILRIDRDSTSRKGEMDRLFTLVQNNKADILVGTQMLSKGHHFPNVTLVGILDADNRLYGTDFRSTERLAQLIIQVAGRAGRADHPGEVYIQTHHPDHPVLESLVKNDFSGLADQLMTERCDAGLPPFSSLAILRAESRHSGDAMTFLQTAKTRIVQSEKIEIWGPMVAQMERRAGRYRAQLFIQCRDRRLLHHVLDELITKVEGMKKSASLRWSLDVDPQDTF